MMVGKWGQHSALLVIMMRAHLTLVYMGGVRVQMRKGANVMPTPEFMGASDSGDSMPLAGTPAHTDDCCWRCCCWCGCCPAPSGLPWRLPAPAPPLPDGDG